MNEKLQKKIVPNINSHRSYKKIIGGRGVSKYFLSIIGYLMPLPNRVNTSLKITALWVIITIF